ncbi:MAG: lipid biosynthesis acyltransferase [Gammaproteobacteria bacterium]|jgi:KDO2-lipid IV(A) lauroyltransferase|nr:lipid biosynthesis acyltransferase [Gammaproteobacteria bacterium]
MSIDQKTNNPVIELSLKDHFFLILLKSMAKLSLPAVHRLSDVIYFIAKLLPLKFKKVIAIHIKLCFKDLSPSEQKKLINQSIRHTLYCLAEMPYIWFSEPEKALKYVKQVSGQDIIMQATQAQKSVLILAPHLGSWEMFNLYSCVLHPAAGLYKPRKKAYQEVIIRQAREKRGNVSLYPTTTSGVKALYRAMADKKWIGMLPDHDPGKNGGVYVPFFGIPANTMTLAAKLAQKSDAAVFYCYAERLAHSKGFHIHFVPATADIMNEDLSQAAAAMNKDIEACIRNIPAQYEWSYKRFRRRPNNEAGFY